MLSLQRPFEQVLDMQWLRGTQCKRYCILLFALGALVHRDAEAHDFWIEPDNFRPQIGATVALGRLAGNDSRGDAALFNPEQFNRYGFHGPSGEQPVPGNLGDDPAGSILIGKPGLYAVMYDSKKFEVTFD